MPGVTFEVRWTIEAVAYVRDAELFCVEQCAYFVALPDVETAFLTLRVCIERAEDAAVAAEHFPGHPLSALSCGVGERRLPQLHGAARIQRQQLRIVVEHLFEVGNFPALVDAIAEEATA